ncbi:thioredoxin-disulfide reductase [Vavraia culicis subsp. floridensis]|uniref:Thioredoxin-disulfide reductase n=1 Tax=Vavraia culicis (isolate floridensis) TaxID=948595 RepID=L2GXQ6_VAVCU|nr:thioredoxin-disulfide reductase [Vavraia culicis subsp. floridensis]ELA48451.1 thioredoxin-disulfide reductase [Vavraia culicis subsp. floridensis]
MSEGIAYHVIIIGSGPAAYSAALYLQDYRVLMLEGGIVGNNGPGGQLTTTTVVDNYAGYPNGITGPELMATMKKQAEHENLCTKEETATALSVSSDCPIFRVSTKKGDYFAYSIVIATGAQAKRLCAPGTATFWQKGISTCAVCDGYIFLDEVVAVIGGGDSAMEESLYLAGIARKVYLIHRRDTFRSRKDMLMRAERNKKIEIIRSSTLVEAKGDKCLKSIIIRNVVDGVSSELAVDGLFFAVGHLPNTDFIEKDFVEMDEGYIRTDSLMRTSRTGVFACGDVQDRVYRQASTAAASGCIAAQSVHEYLNSSNIKI